MTNRPSFKAFKEKALQDKAVRKEYDALSSIFDMKRKMIAMRKNKGMTQEQMAEILGTKKSSISRLESLSSKVSPSLATIEEYARALGYSIKVDFEPTESRC